MTGADRLPLWLRETLVAAEHDAEAAAEDAGSADWQYASGGFLNATGPAGSMVATGSQDFLEPALGRFMAANDPAAVLRRIATDRQLLDVLLAERHEVNEKDCWYTCAAATEERDGGETCDDKRLGKPCDCGRDWRVARRVRLLAESWGWTEETP